MHEPLELRRHSTRTPRAFHLLLSTRTLSPTSRAAVRKYSAAGTPQREATGTTDDAGEDQRPTAGRREHAFQVLQHVVLHGGEPWGIVVGGGCVRGLGDEACRLAGRRRPVERRRPAERR